MAAMATRRRSRGMIAAMVTLAVELVTFVHNPTGVVAVQVYEPVLDWSMPRRKSEDVTSVPKG